MWIHQFRGLLWKNYLLRKQAILQTLLEILFPIIAFLLFAWMHSLTSKNETYNVETVSSYLPEEILAERYKTNRSEIFYTPSNAYFDDLIKRVGQQFQLPTKAIHGLEKEQQLVEQSRKSTVYHNFLIIFHSAPWSSNLDYTIRVREKISSLADDHFNTQMLFNEGKNHTGIGSHYLDNGFVAIQRAVDVSFIEMGQEKRKRFSKIVARAAQEFPYPPHRTEAAASQFLLLLPLATMASFIFPIIILLNCIVEEKYTGIKELMKVVGLRNWVLWIGWFIHSLIPMVIIVPVIVIILKVNIFGGNFPLVEYTQGTILFVFFMLYLCANVTLCFFISTWTSIPAIAQILATLILSLSFSIPWGILQSGSIAPSIGMPLMLLPQVAMIYGFKAISYYEFGQSVLEWSNCHHASQGEISMFDVFMMLVVDFLLYLLLTLYVDEVNPGRYGLPKSVFFPIQELWKRYKRKKRNVTVLASRSFISQDVETANLPKGIELINLGKVYGKKPAVKNLNLKIYRDQITVLLGHNGAGKTTTMGMIAGMIQKTSGKIKINGVEVKSRSDITKSMGHCPQDNLFFPSLTVMQHLLIFAALKGQKSQESKREIRDILRKLNMPGKEDTVVTKLSGGMQRKVCLGMALVGGSQILILDEPSSGMDLESRKDMFDMLHRWRNEKTILITTHSMEEADALGDWIVIMNGGELVCCGTPMFLKKKYETGSTLILLIKKGRNVKQAVQKMDNLLTVQFNFTKAKCTGINGNEVRFLVPPANYIKMFEYLESNKDQYDIDNISFKSTTLEDVFLNPKVTHQEEQNEDTGSQLEAIERPHDTNLCLILGALLYKRCMFIFRKWFLYIVITIISLLIVLAAVFVLIFGKNVDVGGPSMKMSLSAYGDTTVYGRIIDPTGKIRKIYEQLISQQKSKFELSSNVSKSIIGSPPRKDLLYLHHKIIVAAEINVSTVQEPLILDAVAMYNCYPVHSAAISFNLISNTMAQYTLGKEYSISTRNHPLIFLSEQFNLNESIANLIQIWSLWIPTALLVFISTLIIFPFSEFSTNFTQTQFMCGVPPIVYWLTTFFFDFVFYLLFALITTVMLTLSYPAFRGADSFGTMYLILTMLGLSAIPLAYLSGRMKSYECAYTVYMGIGMCGMLFFLAVFYLKTTFEKTAKILHKIFLIISPQYGLSHFGIEYALKAWKNYDFAIADKKTRCWGQNENPCCSGENSRACEKWKSFSSVYHPDIWWMFLCAAIYFLLVIIPDCYCLKRVLNFAKRLLCLCYFRGREIEKDTEAEKADHNTLRVKHLRKYYCRNLVIDDVSFSVTKGQCMGILGVNGAGKTTTFRMLVRESVKDGGAIRINGHSVDNIRYLKRLGYCPQENALNLSLTARDTLRTMAMLRGIKSFKIVDQFLDIFGLTKLANIKCDHYSGGNKRKLVFAVAVIGFPDFILLDEPTAGVDPLSKLKFWSLIKQIRDSNRSSFLLTSHSLNECEAVCDELKILKDGIIKKEGPIAILKTEVCGFNVMLKLDKEKVASKQGKFLKTVPELKKYLRQTFPTGTIRDEHSGLIHYYIKTKEKKWSQLFRMFEDLKQSCDLIEDYNISEASLEDVFLTVARTDDEED